MTQPATILGDPRRGTLTLNPTHLPVPFAKAAAYVMPFGQYRGQTIDKIAQSDRGLLWLDWLLAARDYKAEATGTGGSANERETTKMLRAYLTDKTIAIEVATVKGREGRKGRG
jgi:hypothetical protein